MSRQKFWRQIRLPRKAGEANLPDKTYGQELSYCKLRFMTKTVLLSHELIGEKMAGPGIRYMHLARVLAKHIHVVLAAPTGSGPTPTSATFEMRSFERGVWHSIADLLADADVILLPPDLANEFPQIADLPGSIVIDGYNPLLAEWLYSYDGLDAWQQRMAQLRRQYFVGDFYICASERQRDWWLGQLEVQGRINPLTVRADPTLRRLIDVVPYGLSTQPYTGSAPSSPIMRTVWPGIGAHDPVILWGGGLWPWLDPLTAIRAVDLLRSRLPDVRLVFPGTRHPNPNLHGLHTHLDAARALATERGLIDRHVFFGDWVPYERWADVLRESDVALSLHFDTYETRLAFRSRILETIGAGVPVVATRGDATSEIIERFDIGATVNLTDSAATADALQRILLRPRSEMQTGFAAAQAEYAWERSAAPLLNFCRAPQHAADHALTRERALSTDHDALLKKNVEMQDLLQRYENGRFMRLMRRLKKRRD